MIGTYLVNTTCCPSLKLKKKTFKMPFIDLSANGKRRKKKRKKLVGLELSF